MTSFSFSMPALNSAKRRQRLWSSAEIQELRELAARGDKVETIALALRRSSAAVRTKAAMHGISIGVIGRPSTESS